MAVPFQSASDVANEYLTLQFVVKSLLGRTATNTLVKVVSCTNSDAVGPYGFVDVIPLVDQLAGDGTTIAHGTVYRLPYFRLQGGTNAVIIDPKADDIGMAAFCSRDISAVKADPESAVSNANAGKGGAPPGSRRQYSMADGLYIGGFLNGTPEQYVRFAAGGVSIISPTKITLQAPEIDLIGDVAQSGGDITATGSVTADGDVVGNGISLHDHTHGGVQSGGSDTAPPNP